MPSTHIVPIVKIEEIKPHPNADKLEIAIVSGGGWQVLVGIGNHQVGDKVVFVPPDSLVPDTWAEEWKVKSYLAGKQHNRVKCIKLRGESSFGFLVSVPSELKDKPIDTNVMEFFGIEKYFPPVRGQSMPQGQARKSHPLFDKYTGIENFRHYIKLFQEGELVVFLEKIHGLNGRIGLVNSNILKKDLISLFLLLFGKVRTKVVEEWVAGSHNVQRTISKTPEDSPYTFMISDPKMKRMIKHLKWNRDAKQVIIYAEIYGSKIQKLHYGVTGYQYIVFDIKVDGRYLSWHSVRDTCFTYQIPVVPVLYEGEFSADLVEKYGSGKSMVDGADNIREGLIIRPLKEDRTYAGMRKILKYKGIDYMLWVESKRGSDYTEE